jgi:hypothetical protein
MADYDRDIDTELKEMFYRRKNEIMETMQTTSTKIRAIVAPIKEKVEEHDGLFAGLFKVMTSSFGGMMRLDEKLKKK